MKLIRHSVVASFIIGTLVGAAALNLVSGVHIDNAELEIQKLHSQLADQSEQITALEKTLERRQKLAVTEIEIHITPKDTQQSDEFTELEIENAVKKLLKNIRGKEVSSLDPLLITNIIDGRTVEISTRKVLLSVKSLLLSEKLIMYVETTESRIDEGIAQ